MKYGILEGMADKPFDSRYLVKYMGCSTRQGAELLGLSHQAVARWSQGIMFTADQADAYAVRLHAHPAEIWPTWWAEAPLDVA